MTLISDLELSYLPDLIMFSLYTVDYLLFLPSLSTLITGSSI